MAGDLSFVSSTVLKSAVEKGGEKDRVEFSKGMTNRGLSFLLILWNVICGEGPKRQRNAENNRTGVSQGRSHGGLSFACAPGLIL